MDFNLRESEAERSASTVFSEYLARRKTPTCTHASLVELFTAAKKISIQFNVSAPAGRSMFPTGWPFAFEEIAEQFADVIPAEMASQPARATQPEQMARMFADLFAVENESPGSDDFVEGNKSWPLFIWTNPSFSYFFRSGLCTNRATTAREKFFEFIREVSQPAGPNPNQEDYPASYSDPGAEKTLAVRRLLTSDKGRRAIFSAILYDVRSLVAVARGSAMLSHRTPVSNTLVQEYVRDCQKEDVEAEPSYIANLLQPKTLIQRSMTEAFKALKLCRTQRFLPLADPTDDLALRQILDRFVLIAANASIVNGVCMLKLGATESDSIKAMVSLFNPGSPLSEPIPMRRLLLAVEREDRAVEDLIHSLGFAMSLSSQVEPAMRAAGVPETLILAGQIEAKNLWSALNNCEVQSCDGTQAEMSPGP